MIRLGGRCDDVGIIDIQKIGLRRCHISTEIL
jgi:hypothetical protein